MNCAKLRKNNLLLSIYTTIFIVWIVFLILLTIMAEYNPVFYDYMTKTDVSSSYSLNYPLMRYIFEPFIGFIFNLGSHGFDWVISYTILFAITKIIISQIDKRKYDGKLTENPLINFIKDCLTFLVWIFFIVIISCGIIMLIMYYPTEGYLGIANHFVNFLMIGLYIIITLFIIKILYSIKQFIKDKKYSKINRKNNTKILAFRENIANFLKVLVLLVLINISLLTFPLPMQKIETEKGPNELLFDFHVHTTSSDGFISPEERVMWYISQGIDGAAFSDHSNIWGAKRAQKFVEDNNLSFTVLVAQEFTDDFEDIHLNIFGIDENLAPRNYSDPIPEGYTGPFNVSEMVPYVKNKGGYVIVNHFGLGKTIEEELFSFQDLADMGVDGFEIVGNEMLYPEEVRDFCLSNNLIAIAGSDEHMNIELQSLVKLSLPDPNNRSLDAIFSALQSNTHEVIYIEHHSERVSFFSLDAEIFINYLLGLNIWQSISWISWSIIGYLIGLVTILKVRKTKSIIQ